MILLKNSAFTLLLFSGAYFLSSVVLNRKSDITSLRKDTRYTITVVIENLRNKNGRIQLDLYKNQTEYEARTSDKKEEPMCIKIKW